MEKIILGGAIVYLDFALLTDVDGKLGIISYYNRSNSAVKAFGASLTFEKRILIDGMSVDLDGDEFVTYLQPVFEGKEKFYHAISINRALGDTLLLYEKQRRYERFYDFLMKNFELPLLKEWGEPIYLAFRSRGAIWDRSLLIQGDNSLTSTFSVAGNDVLLSDLQLIEIPITAEELSDTVSNLLKTKSIRISSHRQKKLQFTNMDEYFKQYGPTLVKNLEKDIHPLRELDGEAHDFTLNSMRLYPQQLAQVNGDVALIENHKYAIMNSGMGTGKTIMASSVCESYFVRKWLRCHPGSTLADAYKPDSGVAYRNIIMCPGHLAEKWCSEIKREIPFAKVTLITEFKQLLELKAHGARRDEKEFYVMSKDFGKLSFQSIPTVTKRRKGRIYERKCAECGVLSVNEVCSCGSKTFEINPTHQFRTGMVCPHCNRVLIPYGKIKSNEQERQVLDYFDFSGQTTANSKCAFCGEELWMPHVGNVGTNAKEQKWIRATYWANKAHKGKKTVWVHRDYIEDHNILMGSLPLNVIETQGARKYSPAEFIKRYLKGFFDIAIFDEIQDLKGGYTGQGHAMHAIIRSSKKQLCLTGTIAGGMASHLFYTLFRLEPKRMIDKGYTYSSELAFSEQYGKVERTYEYNGKSDDGTFLACCKGKMKSSPKVKPGISPLIFMDFLLDRTTFLDLSDMSRYLPKLKEKVVSVSLENELETDIMSSYRRTIDILKQASRSRASGGMGVLSTMLQFSLSYLDRPYGINPILSPVDGSTIARPENYQEVLEADGYDGLLSKERKLVDLIRSEQAEGRNVVVYCEYTASPETCITYRLKEIIEKYCGLKGKVAILESSSPAAREREAWMHKMAKKGIRVFITNPRCVSTGLDFCFSQDGVLYNYPTLIFYQLGYSMFVTWQASRRAYRLNQTKECRNYYIAWAGSVQEAVISLIAEKQAATSAIQGKFSTEGLAAMANGVDERMRLAQAMSNMDEITSNGLQEMFDVLATSEETDEYMDYKPMLLYKELVGEEAAPTGTFDSVKTGQFSFFDVMDILFEQTTDETDKKEVVDTVFVESTVPNTVRVLPMLNAQSTLKGKKVVSGQFSLFG